MDAASIPWEWVATFLWSHDILSLRVTAAQFNTESLCGEFQVHVGRIAEVEISTLAFT